MVTANHNTIYFIIGLLVAAAVVGGYFLYQHQQDSKKSTISIEIGEGGVTVEED
jgi:predicted negative regulator of RcsB-dependent stress response